MDDWKLQVSTAELRSALNAIVDHLEDAHGSLIDLTEDYFWSLDSQEQFDPEQVPEATIGQYSWSWENLVKEREGSSEATITYAAVWASDILDRIGRFIP